MSPRGKRKDEDVRASDDETETHTPAKKVAKPTDESDDIVVCNISKNRRVSVRNWNGRIWIDIREFYVKDGKTLPGKKEGQRDWRKKVYESDDYAQFMKNKKASDPKLAYENTEASEAGGDDDG